MMNDDLCCFGLVDDYIPIKRRIQAIWFCFWYGIRPWWMYEKTKHHRGTYFDHLIANINYAKSWIRNKDDASDRGYESVVNGSWIK
jgi:hypothetical protein